MNISLLTIGTLGDIQPFTALALGLKELGHRVTMTVPVNLESYVKPFQIPYHLLALNTQELLESESGQRWMASGNVKEFMKELNAIAHRNRYDAQEVILTACQDCDLIIVHPLLLFYAATVAEKLNKPFMLANTFPMAPATREFPHFLVSVKSLPLGSLNKFTHRLFAKVFEKGKAADMNEWRSKLGLKPLQGSLFRKMTEQRIPVLHMYSPALVPHPADWGDHNFVTGQWKMADKYRPQQTVTESDDQLEQWLARGEAPVYFGFGSLPVLEPLKMIEMIREIAITLNKRAIIASGWSSMAVSTPLPDSVIMIRSAHHESLFPRCSVVIHHGGVGTTHTALESGTPSIICSTYADQPFWGERITKLKIGRHIPFPKLTKENLSQAIQALDHEGVRIRAAEIAKRVKAEQGLKNALNWIEKQARTAPVYKN